MIITVSVKAGINKQMCDDTAVINDMIINDDYRELTMGDIRIVGVADGVGGNSGGKQASLFISKILSQTDFSTDSDCLREQLIKLNDLFVEYASTTTNQKQMATTLTALVGSGGKYYLIHIGNTRMYVGQGSYLKQFTQDHTTYQWLLSNGKYEEAESCNKNEIYSCFGGGINNLINGIEVSRIFEDDFPDCIVFTSDGVHEYVDIDELEELVFSGKTDKEVLSQVLERAERNGSEDDKTFIILRK